MDLTDLAEEYFLFTQGGSVFDTRLRECCLRLGFDPKVRFKGVNSDLPWTLLRHNQGIMFLLDQIATFRLFLRRRKRRVRKTGSNRGAGSSSIRYGQKTARRWRMHPYNAKCARLPGQIIVSRFGMDVVRFLQRHL